MTIETIIAEMRATESANNLDLRDWADRLAALAVAAPDTELVAWRELGRCVFLGLPTFPNKWPQDVSVIGYSLSMRRQRGDVIQMPTNRAEAVALARLILAKLDVVDAALDEAIARCEATAPHAPAKAREVAEADVELAMKAWNDAPTGQFIHGERDKACMRAALATFAEG